MVSRPDVLFLLYHCSQSPCRLPDATTQRRGDERALLWHHSSLPSSSLHPTHPTRAPGAHAGRREIKRKWEDYRQRGE